MKEMSGAIRLPLISASQREARQCGNWPWHRRPRIIAQCLFKDLLKHGLKTTLMTSTKAASTKASSPKASNPKTKAPRPAPAEPANPFLPDLCSSQSVFLLVLVAELLAVLLTISASSGLQHFSWDKLALISVQVQWIVVFSAVALCRLRFWLGRQDHVRAGAVSYALVLGITFVLCIAGQWIIYGAS